MPAPFPIPLFAHISFFLSSSDLEQGSFFRLWQRLYVPLFVCACLVAFSFAALGTLLGFLAHARENAKLAGSFAAPLLLFPPALPVLLFGLDFLEAAQQALSVWHIAWQNYAILLAPAGLYGGLGVLLYSHLASDAAG